MEKYFKYLPQIIILLVVFYAANYFLFVRPQFSRKKRQTELMKSLKAGDRVITVGGICGTIIDVDSDAVMLEAAEGIVLRVMKPAIGQVTEAAEGGEETLPSSVRQWVDDDPADSPIVRTENDEENK
ncbi:MAG: preprotein translocase subunit YajC [bacterium]|jgi:preprotein translocase subunit YajC